MLKRIKLRENYIFLILVLAVMFYGMTGLVKNENAISTTENRTLSRFEHFTLDSFLDGSFQDNFENAFSDQFLKSESIRNIYGQAVGYLPTFGLDDILCKNHYVTIAEVSGSKYGMYDCEDYILIMPNKPSDAELKIMKKNIDRLNALNAAVDTYYYYINSSSNFDFEDNKIVFDYEKLLSDGLVGQKGFASFYYNDYETYKKYFYKTDLHWNYIGSYRGFLDIAEMLRIENFAKPTGTFTQNEDFFGSNAKKTQKFNNPDEFVIYTFDIPEHKTIIDGISGESYNHIKQYVEHDYKTSNFDYYAYVYGKNYGEIIFDFNQPTKKNLLIIADSYSNPLNELIAQYYNKTYVIDGRYYTKEMGKDFMLSDYLKRNKIDAALVIMSSGYFVVNASIVKGLEK